MMKIKQQRQIKAFWVEEFGANRGGSLFANRKKKLTLYDSSLMLMMVWRGAAV